MRASLIVSLFLCFAPTTGLARKAPDASGYFKYMLTQDTPHLRLGSRLEPRYARDRLRYLASTTTESRIERLMEWARCKVAPEKPSRLQSIFATDQPGIWKNEIGDPEQRVLVRLQPMPGAIIAVVDAVHYEKAFSCLQKLDATADVRAKRRLLARAQAEAERYWTESANRRGARPEILLGGGAIFDGALANRPR